MTSANVSSVMAVQNLAGKVSKLSEDVGTGVDFTQMLQMNTRGGSGADKEQYQPEALPAPMAKAPSAGSVSFEKEQTKSAMRDQISEKPETVDTRSPEDKEKLEDAAGKLDSEVKKAVAQAAEVSEEDVEKAMEELGLTATDLLVPSNLAELIAQLTDTKDQVQLLLSDMFTQLTGNITDIFADFAQQQGMTVDEFTQVMSELLDIEAAPEAIELPDPGEAGPHTEASEKFESAVIESEETTVIQHEVKTESNGETEVVDTTADGEEKAVVVNTAKPDQKEETGENAGSDKNSESKDKDGMSKKDDADGIHAHMTVEARVEGQRTFEIPQQSAYVPQTPVNPQEIIDQIVEQTRLSYSAQQDTSIEMVLNPEELGRLLLKVASDKNGQMTAQITVQSDDVKEALVQQMAMLRDSLSGQGIKIDAIEVTVSSHAFEQNLEEGFSGEEQAGEEAERQANTRRRNLNLNDLDSLQGLMTEEEMLAAAMMADRGNTMNLTA